MNHLIPDFIAEKYQRKQYSGDFTAYTMFVDISGFTGMTQSLMAHGKEGAEILSQIINDIFSPSIAAIQANGGFVSVFAGDAFTAIFQTKKAEYPLSAAFAINTLFKKSGVVKTRLGEFHLAVKIGLSYGNVEYKLLDAELQKSYYFRGTAVDDCAQAEHQAEKMQIVCDNLFFPSLETKVEYRKIGKKWFQLLSAELELTPIAKAIHPDNREEEFILPAILELKERGEFREIVSVFISFHEESNYQNAMKQIIKKCYLYNSYFNKVDFGDKGGVALVVFGAPVSTEKQYQRAADFAMSVKTIPDFKCRIGMTTGIAFCGFIGSAIRKEYTALGDVVNLSARLMMKAEWGEIIIGPKVAANLTKQYSFTAKGSGKFKGFGKEVKTFKLVSKILTNQQLTFSGSFIGRKDEIDKLTELVHPIFSHQFGGVIYIDGVAGIGKSRFITHFCETISSCNAFFLSCDEILKKPFNPFESFFKRFFEQSENNSKEQNNALFKRKYHSFSTQIPDKVIKQELLRTESILQALIGLEQKDSLYSQLDKKGRYENTLYAVKNFFKAQSLFKPLIIVLDDAQWIDDDSLALLEVLCRNVSNYPLVILALCRPRDDGRPFHLFANKETEANINRLALAPFDKTMMTKFLQEKVKATELPAKTIDFVWDKSEGNPFFVEQLALYLEENNLFDSEHILTTAAQAIPSGISQIILARIDRLSAKMKEMIKTASVLGREFALQVLEKMLQSVRLLELNEFEEELNDIGKEQIWENISEMQYIFKHALIRDTIYEIQLRDSLRRLHNLAGTIIEDLYKNNLEEFYHELAEHYEKAECIEKAILYLEKAGNQAKQNYQNLKAIEFYRRLEKFLDEEKDYTKLISILQRVGEIFELIGNWSGSLEAYKQVMRMAEKYDDKKNCAIGMVGIGWVCYLQGKIAEAEEMLKKTLELAYIIDNNKIIGHVHGNLGIIYDNQGKYDLAMKYFEKKVTVSKEIGDERSYSRAICTIGGVYLNKGEYAKALQCFLEQLAICEKLEDKRGKSLAFGNIGIVYFYQGNYEKAMKYYQKQLAIANEIGDKQSVSLAVSNTGLILFNQGNYQKAMECYQKDLEICKELGNKRGLSFTIGDIGMIYSKLGKYDKAMEYYTKQQKICGELGDKWNLSSSYGNTGVLKYDLGDFEKAIEFYQKQLDISKEIGDKKGVSKAIGSLAEVYCALEDYAVAEDYYLEAISIAKELGLNYFLSHFYHELAILYYLTNRLDDAGNFNQRALEIAIELSVTEVLHKAYVFKHKIDNNPEALKQMLKEEHITIEKKADVYFELWLLTNISDYKQKAVEIYNQIYKKTPKYIFKKRIEL